MAPHDGLHGSTGVESAEEQEISFSASHLLTKLTNYQETHQLSSLAFRKGQQEEIKQRQKFLLTEKPRVTAQGCDIDLGVYKSSPDGVDGRRGPKTESSTTNYLTRLFDKQHPERRTFVSTKLTSRAKIESNRTNRTQREGALITESRNRVAETKAVQTELTTLKEQKTTLLTTLTTDQVDLIVPQIDRQIEQLESSIQQTIDLERNISLEEERTTNLFFVVTLDGNKVLYNEEAEQLHASARQAITSVANINATTAEGKAISIQRVLDDFMQQKQQEIRTGAAYQQAVEKLEAQGISHEQAIKIADEQTTKAATTLAIREFSHNISNENTYGFSVETITQIKNNEDLAIFNKLFEKVIIDWYEDITDLNHLDRELPVPLDPYFETVTKVTLYENPEIETYLFDSPAKDPTALFAANHRSKKANEHVRKTILGEKSADEEYEETASDEKTTTEQFYQELNIYSSKRLRQLLLYQQFRTIKDIFQQTDSQGVTLQTSCNFSLADLRLDDENHTLELPFTYENLSTQLTIHGGTGEVTFPTLLDRISGTTSFPTLAQSKAQRRIEEELLQTAKLTNEELLLCTSRKDVEEMITAKMSQKLLEFHTSPTSPEQIAQKIEHEALLANLWGYMDNTHGNKQAIEAEDTQKAPLMQEGFLGFIQHLVTDQKGHLPLTLEATRKINKQLTNPNMHHLFAQLTKQPGGFENFFMECNLLDPQPRPTKITDFFALLENIANATEKPQQESNIVELRQFVGQITPPLIGSEESGGVYVYTNKQFFKRS